MTTLVELGPRWLRAAADPAQVARALETTVPELGPDGRLQLQDVGLSWRLRKDERRWRGTIRVTTTAHGGDTSMLTRLRARLDPPGTVPDGPSTGEPGLGTVPFGQPGWSCTLLDLGITLSCEQDEQLPALTWLTDADEALPRLVEMLGETRPDSAAIVGCTPQILRYKLGSRCTVGYDFDTTGADDQLPTSVIAKVYAGNKGAIAHESMAALWASPLRRSEVAIAEPLGYDPERRLLLQGPVPGDRTLKQLMIDAFQGDACDPGPLEPLIRKSARGLADLHRSGVSIGQTRRWRDDLDELTSRRNRVLGVVPELASYGAELLAALEELDRSVPPDPDVPSHGSFRAAQVLVDDDDIGFIDFDSFAQAEPALDVAEFAFRLEQLALVKTATQRADGEGAEHRAAVDHLTSAFLDEYRRHAEVSQERVTLWWAVAALSLVFSSFTKLKLARLPACVDLVETVAWRANMPTP